MSPARLLQVQLEPACLEEIPHGVARLAHWRVVLIERLTVVEDYPHVVQEILLTLVPTADTAVIDLHA